MKRIICDSSSLISLSMNCMLPLITELSQNVDFIITQCVYDEIITNPRRGHHHPMGPLKFKALVDNGVLKIGRADKRKTEDILNLSNSIYYLRHKPLTIIQRGEAEALALAEKGEPLLMDERTLRLLMENPHDLKTLLQYRLHKGVSMNDQRAAMFQKYADGVPVIRSSELLAVAYEKGILEKYFSGEKHELLHACLWALKLRGCSLSSEDIEEYMQMVD